MAGTQKIDLGGLYDHSFAIEERGEVHATIKWNKKTYELYEGENLIGKGEKSDVIIEHKSISDIHCEIILRCQKAQTNCTNKQIEKKNKTIWKAYCKDMRSTNGTFIQKELKSKEFIKLTRGQQVELTHGCDLRLGIISLHFEMKEEEENDEYDVPSSPETVTTQYMPDDDEFEEEKPRVLKKKLSMVQEGSAEYDPYDVPDDDESTPAKPKAEERSELYDPYDVTDDEPTPAKWKSPVPPVVEEEPTQIVEEPTQIVEEPTQLVENEKTYEAPTDEDELQGPVDESTDGEEERTFVDESATEGEEMEPTAPPIRNLVEQDTVLPSNQIILPSLLRNRSESLSSEESQEMTYQHDNRSYLVDNEAAIQLLIPNDMLGSPHVLTPAPVQFKAETQIDESPESRRSSLNSNQGSTENKVISGSPRPLTGLRRFIINDDDTDEDTPLNPNIIPSSVGNEDKIIIDSVELKTNENSEGTYEQPTPPPSPQTSVLVAPNLPDPDPQTEPQEGFYDSIVIANPTPEKIPSPKADSVFLNVPLPLLSTETDDIRPQKREREEEEEVPLKEETQPIKKTRGKKNIEVDVPPEEETEGPASLPSSTTRRGRGKQTEENKKKSSRIKKTQPTTDDEVEPEVNLVVGNHSDDVSIPEIMPLVNAVVPQLALETLPETISAPQLAKGRRGRISPANSTPSDLMPNSPVKPLRKRGASSSSEMKDAVELSLSQESAPKRSKTARKPASPVVEEGKIEQGDPTCILFTGVEKDSKMEKMARDIGAEIVSDPSPRVTHCITTSEFKRTPKLLMAVNYGVKYIVTIEWLKDSARKHQPIQISLELESDEESQRKYLIHDSVKENTWRFQLLATLRKNRNQNLFTNLSFYVTKGVFGHGAPPEDELKNIVQSGGGTWVNKLPTATQINKKLSEITSTMVLESGPIVISSENVMAKEVTTTVRNYGRTGPGQGIYSIEFLFLSILRYEINFQTGLLERFP